MVAVDSSAWASGGVGVGLLESETAHTPTRKHVHTQSKMFIYVLEVEVAGNHEDLEDVYEHL